MPKYALVLILVLMECSLTLRPATQAEYQTCLNPCSNGMLPDGSNIFPSSNSRLVLILVLMECSLTFAGIGRISAILFGLNPCSNGMLPDNSKFFFISFFAVCLNPCSNGMLPDHQSLEA